jgi:hypothetical protein
MSKRVLVMLVVLGLLAAVGTWVYIYSTPETLSAAEDCEDTPKPKDEFAMAAECDAPPEPAGAAAPPASGAGSR